MIHITLSPDPDVEPGHQFLVVDNNEKGRALCKLLMGELIGLKIDNGRKLAIAHNADVDREIVELINELARVRFSAPDLVQLTLQETSE